MRVQHMCVQHMCVQQPQRHADKSRRQSRVPAEADDEEEK